MKGNAPPKDEVIELLECSLINDTHLQFESTPPSASSHLIACPSHTHEHSTRNTHTPMANNRSKANGFCPLTYSIFKCELNKHKINIPPVVEMDGHVSTVISLIPDRLAISTESISENDCPTFFLFFIFIFSLLLCLSLASSSSSSSSSYPI